MTRYWLIILALVAFDIAIGVKACQVWGLL